MNKKFLSLYLLCVFNLLCMHLQLALTVEFEYPFKADAVYSCIFASLIDTTAFFLIGLLLTWGRVRAALLITFACTLLLSLINVVYSRFFGHYLPILAITQAGNLNDAQVLRSILAGLRPADILYLLLPLPFGWLYLRWRTALQQEKWVATFALLWTGMLATVAAFIFVLALFHDPILKTSFTRFHPLRPQYYQAPNNMLFRGGFLRRALTCRDDFRSAVLTLTPQQAEDIRKAYTDYSERSTPLRLTTSQPHNLTTPKPQNLIFIIVESYLSQTSDLKVGGKEITPFLNKLKRDSNVYYNAHVRPNINMGESSDGQFIYMTGLLPLKSDITVNLMKEHTAPGLPKTLMEHGAFSNTHTVVPTSPTFWEQDAMNRIYGIQQLYSKFDYPLISQKTNTHSPNPSLISNLNSMQDLNDAQIFEMATRTDNSTKEPFFSLILTMSMHNPYDKCEEHGFTLSDESLTPEYRNYLTDCHYFDMQIEKYIKSLRRSGIYDRSIIVIVADHHAHHTQLNMAEESVSKELPLYIVNGGIDRETAWQGTCNQLDVYTTLLDLLGVTPEWRGFGHTLLKNTYSNSATEQAQTYSEQMIRSNYFVDK